MWKQTWFAKRQENIQMAQQRALSTLNHKDLASVQADENSMILSNGLTKITSVSPLNQSYIIDSVVILLAFITFLYRKSISQEKVKYMYIHTLEHFAIVTTRPFSLPCK
jgi:hypothetical protein